MTTDLDQVLLYHDRTKHHFRRLAAGPHGLDWATQPYPFRQWEGAELRSLDVTPIHDGPSYATALVAGNVAPAPVTKESISRLCRDSLGLSAWKQSGPSRWALRVNPSSGNLHPTEGYLLLPPVAGIDDAAVVHHYMPLFHGLERRAEIPAELWARTTEGLPPGAFLFALTSIHWREAWKYGERAFRYCQHDVGHAIAAVSFAAAGLGWRVSLLDAPGTNEVAALVGVHDSAGPEVEHADCLLVIDPTGGENDCSRLPEDLVDAYRALEWYGTPNELSPDHRDWPVIDVVTRAVHKPRTADANPWRSPTPAATTSPDDEALRSVLHRRRSGVAFDGRTGMSAATFHTLLESVMPHAGRRPFDAFPWRPRIDLALFVHRVDGYAPGLYYLARDPERVPTARAALAKQFTWERCDVTPPDLPLFLLHEEDARGTAQDLSCQQAIAGDSAFSLGMVAEYASTIEEHGSWMYPRLFWETGAVGQRLYVESEAVGLRSTGIGCFFDDAVHEVFGIGDRSFQSLYHFTIGRSVEDPRIQVHPPYAHLTDRG